jgi:hypothetical protein
MIPIYPASAPPECLKTSRIDTTKNKNKKDPYTVINQSQHQHSNQHERQHTDHKSKRLSKSSASKRKQCTSVAVNRSKILGFHSGESQSFQNNSSTRSFLDSTKRPDLSFSPLKPRLGTQGAPPKLKTQSATASTCQGCYYNSPITRFIGTACADWT